MEGLEVSVLRKSEALIDNATLRVDPEYFIKDAVRAYHLLSGQTRFGKMIESGYRVVYENTKVVEREEGIEADLPFFLQSADITTPFINDGTLSCVPEGDWDRYPKGRIIPGELLVEVKGKAEKVAIVPDDFPARTLVTGTCFKISPISPSHRSLMLAYLMSDHGAVLKNRLKTNLLVSYIAKDDLYRLPFPVISDPLRLAIHEKVQAALDCRKEILGKTAEAEATLLAALGLAGWSPPEPLSYTARAADIVAAGRNDAQYFRPKYDALIAFMDSQHDLATLAGVVTKGRSVSYSEDGDVKIIRSGDLNDLENDARFLLADSSEPIAYLRKGDVLISSIGFGSIGKVQVFDKDGKYGTVSEVTIVRQKTFNPYYLAAFLSSEAGQLQIDRFITGATGQLHLYPRDVQNIHIPIASEAVQNEIEAMVQSAFTARARSRALLSSAKRVVEIAIEDGEAAALAFLAAVDLA